jgi:hypothetical protein
VKNPFHSSPMKSSASCTMSSRWRISARSSRRLTVPTKPDWTGTMADTPCAEDSPPRGLAGAGSPSAPRARCYSVEQEKPDPGLAALVVSEQVGS